VIATGASERREHLSVPFSDLTGRGVGDSSSISGVISIVSPERRARREEMENR
jgi:hypothetical protein